MDVPTRADVVADLGVELTREAEILAAQALRLRIVHEKALARQQSSDRTPARRDD